jgi:hypothetical protein
MGAQHERGLGGKSPQQVLTIAYFNRWAYPVFHDLNFSNCPMRICMPRDVAGARPIIVDPYADFLDFQLF